MSRIVRIQNTFTSGELDPKLRARIDLQQYYNGLETANNIVIQPQGGFTRRPGLRYITALPASADTAVRFVSFEFSVNDSYMLCFVDQRMYVFKAGALITNINASGNDYLTVTKITSAIIPGMCWAQSADTLIITEQTVIPQQIVRGATDADWTVSDMSFDYIPQFPFTLATANPAATLTPSAESGKVTLTAGAAVFSAGDVNQYIDAQPQGRARIVEYVSTTVVKAVTEVPFFDTTAIPNGNWTLESGYEDTWSASRGWPRTAVFYEGRLYLGGSTSRPSTLWGSRVGQFFDFDPGEAYDDAGLEATLDTGRFNAIVDLYAGRNLQVFTTGGEFYIPQTTSDPITPSNLSIQEQTNNGAKPGIRVSSIDGATVFIQRQGKTISEFLFNDTVNGYTSTKISLLSGHLLKSPKDMAVRNATSTDEGNRLLIVNDEDGSIACYTMLRSQEIIAPSSWDTDGDFLAIGVDIEDIYTVAKRTVNGATVYYVELFDDALTLDSAVTGGAGATASLAHLEAKNVQVIRDGIVEAEKTVTSGVVTFTTAATTSHQVGLNFTPTAKTLPAEPRLQSGPIRGFKKRILEVNSEHFESQAVTVNGEQVSFRQFGVAVLDVPIQPFTGVKTSGPLLGFSDEAQITITQTVPLPMNVLALDYKLSTGQ